MSLTGQLVISEKAHTALKAVAVERGLKLGYLANAIVLEWLDGNAHTDGNCNSQGVVVQRDEEG